MSTDKIQIIQEDYIEILNEIIAIQYKTIIEIYDMTDDQQIKDWIDVMDRKVLIKKRDLELAGVEYGK